MKRALSLISVITCIMLLIGCSKPITLSDKQADNKMSSKPNSPSYSENTEYKRYSEDEVSSIFYADKDPKKYEIIESVLVDDYKIPALKAVMSFYDKEADNICNLAFIFDSSIQEICFAVNETKGVRDFEITDDSHLSYIGNGGVTTSIRKIETNEILNYTVIFSNEKSTSSTNFKIISDKCTK